MMSAGRLLGLVLPACIVLQHVLPSAGLVEDAGVGFAPAFHFLHQRAAFTRAGVGGGAVCAQRGGAGRGGLSARVCRASVSLWMQEADAPPGAAEGDAGTSDGLTRKERRRQNRSKRNNSRNRIAGDAASGGGSIRRNAELSQHFLTDPMIIERLVDEVQDTSDGGACVVELGPGLGAITAPLLALYPKMTAVELDGLAVAELRGRFPVALRSPASSPAPAHACECRGAMHHGRVHSRASLKESVCMFSCAHVCVCVCVCVCGRFPAASAPASGECACVCAHVRARARAYPMHHYAHGYVCADATGLCLPVSARAHSER